MRTRGIPKINNKDTSSFGDIFEYSSYIMQESYDQKKKRDQLERDMREYEKQQRKAMLAIKAPEPEVVKPKVVKKVKPVVVEEPEEIEPEQVKGKKGRKSKSPAKEKSVSPPKNKGLSK